MGDVVLRPESAAAASSSDRDQWERVLGSLVDLLRLKQSQIESLVDDRKFLEDYVHLQHDRWVSKSRLMEAQITQLRKEADLVNKVESAGFDYLIGLKNQEIGCYKVELDHAQTDLEDLLACIKTLCQHMPKIQTPMENGKGRCSKPAEDTATMEDEKRVTILEKKLKKLKLKCENLAAEKDAEISALLKEKAFIWNQFQKADEECTSLRKTTAEQLAQSNEAMEKLQATIESLQSTVLEKDEDIMKLKDKVASLELDLQRQSEEAERSNQMLAKHQKDEDELRASLMMKDELIRELMNSRAKLGADTPRTVDCKTRVRKQQSAGNRSRCASVDHRTIQRTSEKNHGTQNRNSAPLTRSRLYSLSESAGLKRCAAIERATRMLDNPRLFSSDFKIPKLKKVCSPQKGFVCME